MAFTLKCKYCGKLIQVNKDLIGQKVPCPGCKRSRRVPSPSTGISRTKNASGPQEGVTTGPKNSSPKVGQETSLSMPSESSSLRHWVFVSSLGLVFVLLIGVVAYTLHSSSRTTVPTPLAEAPFSHSDHSVDDSRQTKIPKPLAKASQQETPPHKKDEKRSSAPAALTSPPTILNTDSNPEVIPADVAILEMQLPAGSKVRLDGLDIDPLKPHVFNNLEPMRIYKHEVIVRFAQGGETSRTLLVQAGSGIYLALLSPDTSRPELVLQRGHSIEGIVNQIVFSPNGKQILTCGGGRIAVLWDTQTGQQIRSFFVPTGSIVESINSVAFSPDGKQILTGHSDKIAILWNVQTGQQIRSFRGHTSYVGPVAFSPDGKQILTGSSDCTAIVWDTQTGEQLRSFRGHTKGIASVAFSPDGRQILTGSGDNTAVMWDTQTGLQLRSFRGHTKGIASVAFSSDGRQILTGSGDNTAVMWDTQTGRQLRSFKGAGKVAFSPDGRQILTGSIDSSVILWDAQTGQKLRSFLEQNASFALVPVAFSPDGKQILTGSYAATAILWDAQTGQKLRSFLGDANTLYSVAFSPDGKQILTGHFDKIAILWNAQTGRQLHSFPGHAEYVAHVAFRPDGKQILTSSGRIAILWDAQSGQKLRSLEHRGHICSVEFSPNGKQILTFWDDRDDRTATLWDPHTGELIRSFQGDTQSSNPFFLGKHAPRVTFSPDSKQIISVSDDHTAFLWDAQTGQKLRSFPRHTRSVKTVAFSPNGKQLFSVSDDYTGFLWDAQTGQQLHSFPAGHTDGVYWVAFSPDGRQILTGSFDYTAILWDAQTGQKLRSFLGHASVFRFVSFSPDGKQILTGNSDGTIRIWNVATGDELACLINAGGGKDWAVVTPEGLFDGTKGAREKVLFRVGDGLTVVPLDRFFQDFYYPGLLAEIWRGVRPLPGKPLQTNPAPLVKILLNDQPGTDRKEQVTVDVAVTDQGGGISGPWVQHNRATLRYGPLVKTEGKTVHYRIPVSLVPGENRIDVRASTGDGIRESDPASLSIPFSGKLPEPELYVIAIGINRHTKDSGVTDLDCCATDTKALAQLFKQRSGTLYRQVHVTQLLDEQATKDGILKAIQDVASRAKPQDTLVVSVSSHGISLGQRFYLIPHDFKLTQPQQSPEKPRPVVGGVGLRGYREVSDDREVSVRARGLAIDELGEVLAEVPALKRVLLFGTCHSGSAIQLAGKQHNPFAFRGAVERFSRAQGVYCLSASKADELAAETKELGHSLFTYALLAGVRAAEGGPLAGKPIAGEKDSAIDVLSWFDYARKEVPGLYEKYVGRPQQIEVSGEDQPTFPLFSREPK